jgi:hypothetical protein
LTVDNSAANDVHYAASANGYRCSATIQAPIEPLDPLVGRKRFLSAILAACSCLLDIQDPHTRVRPTRVYRRPERSPRPCPSTTHNASYRFLHDAPKHTPGTFPKNAPLTALPARRRSAARARRWASPGAGKEQAKKIAEFGPPSRRNHRPDNGLRGPPGRARRCPARTGRTPGAGAQRGLSAPHGMGRPGNRANADVLGGLRRT